MANAFHQQKVAVNYQNGDLNDQTTRDMHAKIRNDDVAIKSREWSSKELGSGIWSMDNDVSWEIHQQSDGSIKRTITMDI